SSTAPRSRGSATCTAPAKAPSRRGGLRGPRRPRVPLLLLANGSSWGHVRMLGGGGQLGREARRDGGNEGSRQRVAARRRRDAGEIAADVGTPAVQAPARVEANRPVRRADDAQQLALRPCRSTRDAGTERRPARGARSRGGAYDDTSPEDALALLRARGLAAGAAATATGSASEASSSDPAPLAASGSTVDAASALAALVARGLRAGFAGISAIASAGVSAAGAASGDAWGAASAGSGSVAARSAAAFASATDTSLRMSIRQPVSRAARRAFWPSRPMASESIR